MIYYKKIITKQPLQFLVGMFSMADLCPDGTADSVCDYFKYDPAYCLWYVEHDVNCLSAEEVTQLLNKANQDPLLTCITKEEYRLVQYELKKYKNLVEQAQEVINNLNI